MWISPERWWSARWGGSWRRYCSLLILSAFFLCEVSAFSWRLALSLASKPRPTSIWWASYTGVPTRVQAFRYWTIPFSSSVILTISLTSGPLKAWRSMDLILCSTSLAISWAVSTLALSYP